MKVNVRAVAWLVDPELMAEALRDICTSPRVNDIGAAIDRAFYGLMGRHLEGDPNQSGERTNLPEGDVEPFPGFRQLEDRLNDRWPASLAQTPEEFRSAVTKMAEGGDEEAALYIAAKAFVEAVEKGEGSF